MILHIEIQNGVLQEASLQADQIEKTIEHSDLLNDLLFGISADFEEEVRSKPIKDFYRTIPTNS